jgi:hypothetical protein
VPRDGNLLAGLHFAQEFGKLVLGLEGPDGDHGLNLAVIWLKVNSRQRSRWSTNLNSVSTSSEAAGHFVERSGLMTSRKANFRKSVSALQPWGSGMGSLHFKAPNTEPVTTAELK